MIEIVEQIFGTYTLVDGKTNFGYIAGVVIFCIVLYSALRILGSVVGGRR